jgi:hypothetical protein
MNVRTLSEAMIDQTLADSFPASDPPAWTLGRDIHLELSSEVASSIEAHNNEPATTINPAVGGRVFKWSKGATTGWNDRQHLLVF